MRIYFLETKEFAIKRDNFKNNKTVKQDPTKILEIVSTAYIAENVT